MMALFEDRIGFTKLIDVPYPPPPEYFIAVPARFNIPKTLSLEEKIDEVVYNKKRFWFYGYERNMPIYKELD
jgi:hypothetical protein